VSERQVFDVMPTEDSAPADPDAEAQQVTMKADWDLDAIVKPSENILSEDDMGIKKDIIRIIAQYLTDEGAHHFISRQY
jgi:hypothetical protein